jgi:signal transduction histidine kinase
MKARLLASYLSLAVLVLLVLEIPLGVLGARREHDLLFAQAQRDATALAVLVQESLEHPQAQELNDLVRRYQGATGNEVVVVDPAGRTLVQLAPNEPEDLDMTRADLTAALNGRSSTRLTTDEGDPVAVATTPVQGDGTAAAVVAVTVPAGSAEHRIHVLELGLGIVAVVVLAITTLVGLALARSVSRPLSRLKDSASRLGAGELSTRAVAEGPGEVRALANAFNDMADRLEELVTAQHRFVADASHQLRSPLTALRLRLENLQIAHPDTSDELEAATGEVLRLSRLIDGLLTLTRAEGARGERQVVDVATVLDERQDAWSALADERTVGLVVDFAGSAAVGSGAVGSGAVGSGAVGSGAVGSGAVGSGAVGSAAVGSAAVGSGAVRGGTVGTAVPRVALARLVPGDLEQILDNLLANALDATPPGGVIALSTGGDRGHVIVHVRDNGPGMTEAERACAFDRFWRGTAAGDRSTGLGLAIVQQLVRANGGEIELGSAAGGGLDVSITLERAPDGHVPATPPRAGIGSTAPCS